MKLTTHDAATVDRRGQCPRNPYVALLISLVFGWCVSGQVLAQDNFFFTGYLTFQQDGTTHQVTFEDYGPFGQNAPIPGYSRDENIHSSDGEFHLSCSDPLIGGTATVEEWQEVAGQPGLTEPPYDIGTTVTIIDFDLNRSGPGQGISSCAPERPEVGKTAVGSFDREFLWTISKTASPVSANIFFNDTQAFDYTVDVAPDGILDFNYAVSGVITVRNVLSEDIEITAVTDVFPGLVGDVEIECTPAFPVTLAPAGADLDPQLECTYSGASDGTEGSNTATVTYSRGVASGLLVSASDDFAFPEPPANLINTTVSVTDSFDGADPGESLGTCSDRAVGCSFVDSRTLDCAAINATESGNSGSKSNTATITETGQNDSATVTLTCHAPTVTKTADPAFTREYFWAVTKALEGDDPPLLAEGQSYELAYTIDVDLADPAFSDSDFGVSGSITVSNPSPIDAVINSVSDVFTGGSNIEVDCDGDGPYTITAGDSLTCSYSGDSDGSEGTNTATAVQQNHARAADGTATLFGTTDYSGTADFAFVTPTTLVDACVDVIDILSVDGMEVDFELLTQAGFDADEASVCAGDVPVSFSYTFEETWFEAGDSTADPPLCELLVDNTAEVIKFDRDALEAVLLADSSVQTTLLNADCAPEGCTLTQGYWKTHSAYGPAPYDDNWARVGNIDDAGWNALGLSDVCPGEGHCGEDTPLFGGDTWYNVFWTPPAGGNVYYSLAHQYMAATLNVLNGAAIPAHVNDAREEATDLFGRCGAEDFERTRRGRWGRDGGACEGDRARANELAGLLDSYNNGNEGVLHCSDVEYDD